MCVTSTPGTVSAFQYAQYQAAVGRGSIGATAADEALHQEIGGHRRAQLVTSFRDRYSQVKQMS